MHQTTLLFMLFTLMSLATISRSFKALPTWSKRNKLQRGGVLSLEPRSKWFANFRCGISAQSRLFSTYDDTSGCWVYKCSTIEDIEVLGKKLAGICEPGDTLLLRGDLGAGMYTTV